MSNVNTKSLKGRKSNAAGDVDVIIAAFLVGRALKLWSSTRLLLPTLAIHGVALVAFVFASSVWQGRLLWVFFLATEQFFPICTATLRQTVVPNQLPCQVQTVKAFPCSLARGRSSHESHRKCHADLSERWRGNRP